MSEGMEDRIRVLEAQVAELAVHLARSMNHLHELDERAAPAETADFFTTTDQRLGWLSNRIDEVETLVYRDSQPPPDNPATWTYGDPEPPIGSVVLDQDGGAWQRLSLDWCLAGLDDTRGWNGLRKVGPLTLIHRGPEPEPPTTWKFSDPEPPEGTILAANRQPPVTAIGGHMYATDTGYCREDELNRTADHCQVLRWGWTK